jgi:hypothetical protein
VKACLRFIDVCKGGQRIKWPQYARFYNIIPIDAPSTTRYKDAHRRCAAGEFANRVFLANSKHLCTRLDHSGFQLCVEKRLGVTKYF